MTLSARSSARRLAGAVAAAAILGSGSGTAGEWHALPVAGGTDAVAAAAGLEPGLPGWRVLYEATQRRHGLWGEGAGAARAREATRPAGTQVALPLAPDLWLRILGRGGVADDALAVTILGDRRASRLYRGLAGLDEPTLAALAADVDALRRIRESHADAFAAFGGSFRVRDGAVAVPGGADAAALWEELVGESPRAPAAFLVALLAAKGGRRAFLFDSLARLDAEHQRFALGTPSSPSAERRDRLRALAAVFDLEAAWWKGERGAFARPDADAARLLREVRLRGDGTLAAPAAQAFWEMTFRGNATLLPNWTQQFRASAPAGATWLAEKIGTGDGAVRRLRFEQLGFAQRVFGEAGEASTSDVLVAVQGLRDARSLVLVLERAGSRDPALFAAGVKAARLASSASGPVRLSVQGGLQGALGMIDRARFARTLDVAAAEQLARTLFGLPFGEKGTWGRALAGWVETALLPELARAVYGSQPPGEPETTILRAMAGDRADTGGREGTEAFDWEGLRYRADPGRAEFARLDRVRARQGGESLEEALRVCRLPPARGEDLCGSALGTALTSIVYAAHLGDPDGPALAGEDPSHRHDFGADPWELPEEVLGPGVPWHVRGSLLGLETALARLSLHRLAGDALPDEPPVIDIGLRRALALPAALANPRETTDADRDAVAVAIEAGRRRVAALRPGAADVEAAVREAGLDAWRARAFEWLLEHEPGARDAFFSLGELLQLGAPGERPLDSWGAADTLASGLRLRLPPSHPLDDTAGRKPETAVEENFVDLGLRVAQHLSERRLPASLAPALVSTLLPDLFAEARPVATDDRLGLDAWVRAQPRERFDDAVASLAGRGPLQPAPGRGGAP